MLPQFIGAPNCRGDGRNTKLLVNTGAGRIINTCDDPRNPEDALGNQRRDNVAVVAICHRGKTIGLFDTCLDEDVTVEPCTNNGLALEGWIETAESMFILVDYGNLMPLDIEGGCQTGSYPSTA